MQKYPALGKWGFYETDEKKNEKYIYIYINVIAFINLVSENNKKTTTNGPGFQTIAFLWLW